MNILLISSYGETTPLGYRCVKDGHKVKMFIKDQHAEETGAGLVEKVEEWVSELDWADLIVYDDTHNGKEADYLRSLGYNVIGGTEYTDKLENDRDFGQKEMEDAGFTPTPSIKFKTFEEAKDFVNNYPGRYVVKLNGKASDDKYTTYVGKEEDGSDLLAVLDHYEEKLSGQVDGFEIQRVIDGIEMGVGGAFNGTDFINPIEINFEHKKFATGDLGQNTGEMGTSMFFVTKDHPIYKQTLAKMVKKLQGYHGMFDINFIWTSDTMYPLEPTCRFGFPAVTLQMEVIASDYGERLKAIASDLDPNSKILYKFVIGINGVVPPFPYEAKDVYEKMTKDNLVIVKDPEKKGINPVNIKEEKGKWYSSGLEGIAFVATATGNTMKEAQDLAYARIRNVTTPNLWYRTDIGDRWTKDYPKLKEWGWL